ncbi:MAG: 30S ribosomal protein S18 [Spirochaetaceae bacterium]|nr:MAG: 30S ribosomal protein S18 [Spirochaetaceae bacterium]
MGESSEGESEQREDRRRGRSFDREDGDSRTRRPGGGRSRYRTFYRRKYCKFCSKKTEAVYRDVDTLRRFITDRGKILPRRITGTCPKHQRQLSVAIKQARILALLPFVEK